MKFFNIEHGVKTVTIPVTVSGGKVTYFYGDSLPRIRDGCLGDLILPASAVLDVEWMAPLREERRVQIVERGQTLMLAMRRKYIPADLENDTVEMKAPVFTENNIATTFRFVKAVLIEPLELILRGTKTGVLGGGRCELPTLAVETISVNHAYSVASAKYEPGRRSHSGNVFAYVYYHDPQRRKWLALESLRSTHDAEYEAEHLLSAKQLAEKRAREQRAQEEQAIQKAAEVARERGAPIFDF